MWDAWLAYFLGDPDAMLGHAQQAVEIAERIGDSFSRSWAWFWLGFGRRMRGEWQEAIEALERSLAIASERRTAAEGEGWRLVVLGESYLGLGDADRARMAIQEAIAGARTGGHPAVETYAGMAMARVLLRSGDAQARSDASALLARAQELTQTTGGIGFAPLIHVELAELARHRGDQADRQRELHNAYRLFSEIGAPLHAERLAAELALPAS
jgi:tetratricopeptide (TPR) repeat protein